MMKASWICRLDRLLLPLFFLVSTSSTPCHAENDGSPPVRRRAIVGGVVADPGRFPYYVRLDYDGVFGCGGSLITNEFVLTAAHCAFPSDLGSVTAVVGGHNYTTLGVPRSVLNIFPHIAYDDLISVSNDVALLKIEPIPDDLNISMLQYQSSRDFVQAGDSVTVIGLGVTETDEAAVQLRQVELRIVDETTCDEVYMGAIHRKSMLCAADPGEDACQGDSGGPMIVLGDTPSDDIQVGVVSWGEECGSLDKPGVYADVAYLQPWIETMVCKYSENPPIGCELLLDTQTGPIILNPDTDICRDFPGAFYTGWWHQFQRCDWLREGGRINSFCLEYNEAWVNCPLTCHECTYEADDDYYEGQDDWTNYDQSSNPAARVGVVIVSLILLCFLVVYFGCCRCCGRCCSRRDKKGVGQDQVQERQNRPEGVRQDPPDDVDSLEEPPPPEEASPSTGTASKVLVSVY
jgi:hypothetical protein